jgi:hypothetical protein
MNIILIIITFMLKKYIDKIPQDCDLNDLVKESYQIDEFLKIK